MICRQTADSLNMSMRLSQRQVQTNVWYLEWSSIQSVIYVIGDFTWSRYKEHGIRLGDTRTPGFKWVIASHWPLVLYHIRIVIPGSLELGRGRYPPAASMTPCPASRGSTGGQSRPRTWGAPGLDIVTSGMKRKVLTLQQHSISFKVTLPVELKWEDYFLQIVF